MNPIDRENNGLEGAVLRLRDVFEQGKRLGILKSAMLIHLNVDAVLAELNNDYRKQDHSCDQAIQFAPVDIPLGIGTLMSEIRDAYPFGHSLRKHLESTPSENGTNGTH